MALENILDKTEAETEIDEDSHIYATDTANDADSYDFKVDTNYLVPNQEAEPEEEYGAAYGTATYGHYGLDIDGENPIGSPAGFDVDLRTDIYSVTPFERGTHDDKLDLAKQVERLMPATIGTSNEVTEYNFEVPTDPKQLNLDEAAKEAYGVNGLMPYVQAAEDVNEANIPVPSQTSAPNCEGVE